MILAFKYRLYPTPQQVAFLEGQLREACSLYNAALQERRDAWRAARKSVGFYHQDAQLKEIRAEGLTGLVSHGPARDVLRRVDRSFQAFFRRVKAGQKAGFPRFQSFRHYDSLAYTRYGTGSALLPSGRLRVQGTTPIRVRLHRSLAGIPKTVCIRRQAGRWFVVIQSDVAALALPSSEQAIGIDVGLSHFASLSDGSTVANPRLAEAAQRKVRLCQRRVARRVKGSQGRRQAIRLLQRAKAHVGNQRSDFHHKIGTDLVRRFGLIAVEDLNVHGLAQMLLARQVHDVGWSAFIDKLAYKAANAGRELVKVDPRGTSQTCVCGAAVPKGLKDRWHECPSCGLSAPRDVVSAQVVLQRARKWPSGDNAAVGDASVARERLAVDASPSGDTRRFTVTPREEPK